MSKSEIQLRTYTANDLMEVQRMWDRTFMSTWPIASSNLGLMLKDQGRTHRGWCKVAVSAQVVGIVAFQQRRNAPEEGSISLVLVDPDVRRRRIGTALVQDALGTLRDSGVSTVELGAWADPRFWHGIPDTSPDARAFFHGVGWQCNNQSMDLILDLTKYVAPEDAIIDICARGFRFRRAGMGERDRIVDFVKSEFPGFAPYYEHELEQQGHRIFLVENGPRLDAAIINSHYPHCSGSHWSELLGTSFGVIGALLVRREIRRRRIGFALCGYAVDELRREGCTSVYIHWTRMNALYEALGAKIWRTYTLGSLPLTSTQKGN